MTTQSHDYPELLELRNLVLRKPLGMDISNDDLSDEPDCQHLAYYSNGKIVGCLKIKTLADGVFQIQQMAVHESYQGQGVGAALLKEAETLIKGQGGIKVIVEARGYAMSFYGKHGYTKDGEIFTKINIPHQRMSKSV